MLNLSACGSMVLSLPFVCDFSPLIGEKTHTLENEVPLWIKGGLEGFVRLGLPGNR
jgi:hypothetical protein